jgi:hypothetical protein
MITATVMPTDITKIRVTTMTTTTTATAMVTTSFWLLLLVGDVLRQWVFQATHRHRSSPAI